MYIARTASPSRFPSLFDELFRDEAFQRAFASREGTREPIFFAPAVNIKETEKAFVVTADLPGVAKEEVKIQVDKGVLTLQAERKLEEVQEGENWHLTERREGRFQRSFRLPDTVDTAAIGAQFKNGVLELTLPKGALASARQIEIQA